jgi:hypothetical protein
LWENLEFTSDREKYIFFAIYFTIIIKQTSCRKLAGLEYLPVITVSQGVVSLALCWHAVSVPVRYFFACAVFVANGKGLISQLCRAAMSLTMLMLYSLRCRLTNQA